MNKCCSTIPWWRQCKEQDEGIWGGIWGMVGGCRQVFYKWVGKEFGSTYNQWKNYEVQVGKLSKEIIDFIWDSPTSTKVSSQDEE